MPLPKVAHIGKAFLVELAIRSALLYNLASDGLHFRKHLIDRLKVKGVPERWLQTLTGIFGATTILQLLTLPLFGWQKPLVSAETGQLMLTIPLMLVAAVAIWSLTVMASILRQALEIRIAGSILLVIFCQAVVLFIISLLIGSPAR